MKNKPFSQACENNKQPILEILQHYFPVKSQIFEIGSGTGQHAVFFAEQNPDWQWHTSDRTENHPGIAQWLEEAALKNLHGPYPLDVTQNEWPFHSAANIYSANTSHIMHWSMVEDFFAGVGKTLQQQGYFCLYGPFNFDGNFTSASNRQFDQNLKQRDPGMGLRDFEALNGLANDAGLKYINRHAMPANNFILVWQKV